MATMSRRIASIRSPANREPSDELSRDQASLQEFRHRSRHQRFQYRDRRTTLCCLVGPNGAGKTTTMDLITGRRSPPPANHVLRRRYYRPRRASDCSSRNRAKVSGPGGVSRSFSPQNLEVAFSRKYQPAKEHLPLQGAWLFAETGPDRDANGSHRETSALRRESCRTAKPNGSRSEWSDAGSASAAARRARRRMTEAEIGEDRFDFSRNSRRPTRWWWWSTTWRSCAKSPTWSPSCTWAACLRKDRSATSRRTARPRGLSRDEEG